MTYPQLLTTSHSPVTATAAVGDGVKLVKTRLPETWKEQVNFHFWEGQWLVASGGWRTSQWWAEPEQSTEGERQAMPTWGTGRGRDGKCLGSFCLAYLAGSCVASLRSECHPQATVSLDEGLGESC